MNLAAQLRIGLCDKHAHTCCSLPESNGYLLVHGAYLSKGCYTCYTL